MPVLREPAGHRRTRLPARQRVPALSPSETLADGLPAGLPDEAALLELLTRGEIDVVASIVEASNATLFCTASLDGVQTGCVYKPVAGERPLWDFPAQTLARRERAAYVISRGIGWRVVPPTVFRLGPFGPGSVQWWIAGPGEPDPGSRVPPVAEPGGGLIDVLAPRRVPPGWLRVVQAEGYDGSPVVLAHADDSRLRRMAVFDIVTNNTDRKGGHVLLHPGGDVFGVDNGLTFNTEDKLRTVLWGWAGDPLEEDETAVLRGLLAELDAAGGPGGGLRELPGLLAAAEITRTARRAARLLRTGVLPHPRGPRPSIPWPAF